MSNDNRDILKQFGSTIVSDIIDRYVATGKKATGLFAQKLRFEADERRLAVIDGAGHSSWLDGGRGPGGGIGKGMIERITAWVQVRGIQATPYTRKDGSRQEPEKAQNSLVWAVAMAIRNRGTVEYQRGGNAGVISGAITQQRIDSLTAVFADRYATRVLTDIKLQFTANA
jgi:hypothetical protein